MVFLNVIPDRFISECLALFMLLSPAWGASNLLTFPNSSSVEINVSNVTLDADA